MATSQQQQQQRYRVIERIAAGGMAEVFRAESAGLEGFKKKVAIKRVLPHLSEKGQFINMFLDEARLSAHLGHSNCVQVFDIGRGDNAYFIVMEYVDGADLKAVIELLRNAGATFPVEEACLISVRICEGLAYAHELKDEQGRPLGIVHRDMSPPNVLITRHGEVKIVDFGLAKANSQLEDSQPGIIKGKFGYLSPEAALGKEVDARTDVFAVGIMLWEMLAGRRLFQGKSDLETVRQVQRAEVPDVRTFNPHVPASVSEVITRALARDPLARYQTARELCEDLNRVLFHLPRAVSSFDISRLVAEVLLTREREQARKASQGSLIGSLIDQALIEFTSLQGGSDSARSPVQGSAPLDLRSFAGSMPAPADAPVDWSQSLSLSPASGSGVSSLANVPEVGNLSALEEDSQLELLLPQGTSVPSARAAKKGGGGAVVVVLVLMAILGGVGFAWFKGLLPF